MAITCQRFGRCGNQMFQIAAAIGLSLKYNIPYCIPRHTLDNEKWLPYYFENINYCDDKDGASTAFVYTEPSFAYSEIPKPNHRNFVLSGYFQSYLYSQPYREEILKAFGVPVGFKKGWIFLHFRLGDYKDLQKFHCIISSEYLAKSIQYFVMKGYKNFLVLSDEPDEAEQRINTLEYTNINFEHLRGTAEIEDLSIMASCEGGVMSASSFSWWGAYLGREDREIIYPAQWFGEMLSYHDTSTLCPPNWKAL